VKTKREEKAKDPYIRHTHGGFIRTPSSSNNFFSQQQKRQAIAPLPERAE
jgi:hypothetical protein